MEIQSNKLNTQSVRSMQDEVTTLLGIRHHSFTLSMLNGAY